MLDQAHISSLFENATEGIVLTGTDGIIVTLNPAAERMFGYAPGELSGKPIEVLIPDSVKSHHHQLRDNFYKHPSNRVMGHGRDLHGRRKDGSNMPVEVSLSHYRRDEQLFVIAFIVDITLRKQIEQNMLRQKSELEEVSAKIRDLNADLEMKVEERTQILQQALQRLEQSQQELSEALAKEKELNEIKGRFVSMASHEFRTPLTTVMSSASLLSKYTQAEDQPKRNKHIERITNSVTHLNAILEDFLSLGKLNEHKLDIQPDNIMLADLLHDVAEEMKAAIREDQQLLVESEAGLQVRTDKTMLRNVLINLLSNASKFSDKGAVIKIAARKINDQIEISVTDKGIGIAEEDQPYLFTTFFRGANVANIEGTGLGLHIIKRYIDLLGGTVSLTSKLQEGTTVTVCLPLK